MSAPLLLPMPRERETFGFHSRILLHWRADHMRLTPLAGEAVTLTRAATATIEDSLGVVRTVGHHQSRWTSLDLDGDSVREAPALFLSRDDNETLKWAYAARPQPLTLYVRFVEAGTIALANGRVLHLGAAAGAGPYLRILSTGLLYRAEYHNGSVAVNATLAVAPTIGQRVELRVVLNPDGSVTMAQAINDGAETSATSSAPGSGPAIATAWSAQELWLNGETAAVAGIAYYRTVKLAAGTRTLEDCRGRLW